MAEETVVKYGAAVTWKPVRELAQDISALYSSKRIFEPTDNIDGADTIISKKSTRFTDPNASVCTISSADKGYVYLSKDITAPFRVEKLGESGEIEEKVLAFEFAYHPDFYEKYLDGTKKPVLTTQYLLYREAVENDPEFPLDCLVYTSDNIAMELCNNPNSATGNDFLTISNLIESDRSKIRKFWSYKDGTEDGSDFYADSTEIAGELYMLFDDPLGKGNNCCYIARVAFAGMHNNGNGNSSGPGGAPAPAPWVDGHIAADEDYFVKDNQSPWMSSNKAVTLTGVSMDRVYKYCDDPSTNCNADIVNTVKGFRPETPGGEVAVYPPPPIGCSSQFIWPTLGVEGGGKNSFYSPDILSQYIDWADWRDPYKTPLADDNLRYIKSITLEPSPDDKHFPCYLGEERTGNLSTSYAYLSTTKSTELPYQRWVKVNDTTFVRMVPMEFKVPGRDTLKALLTVPVTIAKILKPKSYQTAIRKRWYDMMYYSLRNIAGYKYKKYINETTSDYRIIGVTWDRMKMFNPIEPGYMNPCLNNPKDTECLCTKCSYERWKMLGLGGEVIPFVGSESDFQSLNSKGSNAAQLWTWESDRWLDVKYYTENPQYIDHDILFPELYFERLLCYNNELLYSSEEGGFVNDEKENKLCECMICYYTSYPESPIELPWEGGGRNTTCDSDESDTKSTDEPTEVTIYNTHAYTFKILKNLTEFIDTYKLPEDAPRLINYLEIGYCYCPATMGEDSLGITLKNRTVSHHECLSNGTIECGPQENVDLVLPEIPSYYNTLSKNEKALLEPTGIECVLDIDKALKPFGYNAYVWKAVDVGGYEGARKDIKIEFAHYSTPAKVCSSGTIMSLDLVDKVYGNYDDDLLYMYNTNRYASKYAYTTSVITDSPCDAPPPAELCPNEEGSIRAFNYNRQSDDNVWEEALYWSNKRRVNCFDAPDPASMASAKIWHRNNDLTSIGTIEIYVAPFCDPVDNTHRAKFLGSCNIQLVPSEETPLTSSEAFNLKVVTYYCGSYAPVSEVINPSQEIEINDEQSFTANATNVIEFKLKTPQEGENFTQVDITIPSDMLVEEKPDSSSGVDLRQKYIILATRASHTNIHSGLAGLNGQVSQNIPDAVKTWATTYAGACRYAEFTTAYRFSSVSPT